MDRFTTSKVTCSYYVPVLKLVARKHFTFRSQNNTKTQTNLKHFLAFPPIPHKFCALIVQNDK